MIIEIRCTCTCGTRLPIRFVVINCIKNSYNTNFDASDTYIAIVWFFSDSQATKWEIQKVMTLYTHPATPLKFDSLWLLIDSPAEIFEIQNVMTSKSRQKSKTNAVKLSQIC
jgi:hypothetical protein